jgi:hypothetical protein
VCLEDVTAKNLLQRYSLNHCPETCPNNGQF